MATSELIGLLANIALTLSLIVAVIFGIAQARQAARDRREDGEPFLNEYFQWLVETIDARMSTTPRRPCYEAHRA